MLALALAVICSLQEADTTIYANPATAALIARGRGRHEQQDSLVRDYRASVHTRFEMVAGRSRFARLTTLLAHESAALIAWEAPNDLKVEIQGTRTAIPLLRTLRAAGVAVDVETEAELQSEVWLDRPWFVPRALVDSIHVMGVPEIGALHPLARTANAYYAYAITDSVILELQDRTVRAVAVRVQPRRSGPSLVAGDMWLDADTGDLVRLRVLFLGEYLWERPEGTSAADSATARRSNGLARRYVTAEAELEYALHQERFWLPYRQAVLVTLRVPLFTSATVPVRAITTFGDYQVNTGAPVVFAVPVDSLRGGERRRSVRICLGCETDTARDRGPDSLGYHRSNTWGGGRWEVTVPPAATLRSHEWADAMVVDLDPAAERRLADAGAALARLAAELPDSLVGRRRFGFAWEAAADAFRFSRVQGVSLGLGYEVRPSMPFSSVLASLRVGLADRRAAGSLTWRWDGPEARFDVSGYRSVREVEPWESPGFGGSINMLFAGHDDADYVLVHGGGFEFTPNAGPVRHTRFRVSLESHHGVAAVAGSSVNDALGGDGSFRPNPSVTEGVYLAAGASRTDRLGAIELRQTAEVLTGAAGTVARGWARVRLASVIGGRPVALRASAGALTGDRLPQALFRVGGPRTVRGYDYGARMGTGMWSAQLDIGLRQRGILMPTVFADVGDLFPTSQPLVGVGAGVSLMAGLVRMDLSKGLNPSRGVRFDLSFRLLQ